MSLKENCFTSFKNSIDSYTLPENFTFPFYYQPHPLCLLAAQELQNHLQTQKDWRHNFGIIGDKDTAIGKMFGVLLVQNRNNEIGYLSAFSGKLAEQNHLTKFVPPVFDLLEPDGFFLIGQIEINSINQQIEHLESNPEIAHLEKILKSENEASLMQIKAHREFIIKNRKDRKSQRNSASITYTPEEFIKLKDQLARESIKEKNQLKDLNTYCDKKTKNAEANIIKLRSEITALKKQRKDLSASLQQKIFNQYSFINRYGIEKNLQDIFKTTSQKIPPAGAGECATPKLLQYAFQWGMKPLAMAEFWWGASPKSAIRQHQNFYPACHGKCQPILVHMLEGIKIDDNPLLIHCGKEKNIEIIYEDDIMLVINKPTELLSVPGTHIEDSVYLRIKQLYPKATGPLIVHRLDMSTSGIMLIALSKKAHKNLQKQFIKRTIKKRYIAVLEGLIKEEEGIIDLPLRVDLDDRPRQLVCYEHGKSAQTRWQLIERKTNQSKVYFYPITGRTHQLRIHSAHINGLNIPIVGDDLYGKKSNRLHLHADYIEFFHPMTKELIHFQVDTKFT